MVSLRHCLSHKNDHQSPIRDSTTRAQENLGFYERVRLLCAYYGYQASAPGRPLLFMGFLEIAVFVEMKGDMNEIAETHIKHKAHICVYIYIQDI